MLFEIPVFDNIRHDVRELKCHLVKKRKKILKKKPPDIEWLPLGLGDTPWLQFILPITSEIVEEPQNTHPSSSIYLKDDQYLENLPRQAGHSSSWDSKAAIFTSDIIWNNWGAPKYKYIWWPISWKSANTGWLALPGDTHTWLVVTTLSLSQGKTKKTFDRKMIVRDREIFANNC